MPAPSEQDPVTRHRENPRGVALAEDFAGRTALVTGGAKNIGLETATALLQRGAEVVVIDKNEDALADVERMLAERFGGDRVKAVRADVGDPASREEGLHRANEVATAPFSLVVNNAYLTGDTARMDPLDVPPQILRDAFETNVVAAYEVVRAALRTTRDDGGSAAVVNVLSGAAFKPVPRRPAYSTTKAALAMLTRQMAADLAPLVRVNAVVPGIVSEGGVARSDSIRAVVDGGGVPLQRIGEPHEVAAAILFLLSDASSYITGATVECTGGR